MHVIKSNGTVTAYDGHKIIVTLKRAGADPQLAETIERVVREQARDNISTKEIYDLIRQELKKRDIVVASTYDLRNALTKLGPSGFKFEQYIAAILKAYNWKTEIPENDLRGLCVDHEIDVVAEKDGETVMIEAKFRNVYGDVVTLKDVMATWARYQDLLDGERAGITRHFDKVWIVTNGRFTDRAEQFGVCKGIHMISWAGPSHSLAKMIDHAKLYPLTVLDNVNTKELEGFSKAGVLLCNEISTDKMKNMVTATGIPTERMKDITSLCERITKSSAPEARVTH